MKKFYKFVAAAFAVAAIVAIIANLVILAKALNIKYTPAEFENTAASLWLSNLGVGVLVAAGLIFYLKAEPKRCRAISYAGIGALLSVVLYGGILVMVNLCAWDFWGAFGWFIGSGMLIAIVFCGTRIWVMRQRDLAFGTNSWNTLDD